MGCPKWSPRVFEICARKRLPKKFVLCASSSTLANPRVKKERKKERETTFVSSNLCTYGPYYVRTVPGTTRYGTTGTTGTTGTFAIYTFSLLVEIKKSLALATGRRQKGNFLFYIRSCLHTILPLLNIVADHHCFAGHSFFPAFLSPQIPGARRRR